ncbi:serine/threonine-protein kinase [Amycolatopsis sp. NPDC051045]|uniref:serine/threonine-protein kinase n=1 Tax=Amycolatopsis sp. NPDC051045 TaxID=3156922 RepID=UPI00343183F5
MLSSGQLLADRYKLTSRIAVGGMGEVWQASDTRLDRTVAVKILKAELSGDAEFLHRFRTEARMTASLNHPGIAAVHDYGETIFDGDLPIAYLVMELVDGDPLAGLLAKHGRLSAEFTLDMLEQAGNALQAAHSHGLVHRDVKPGNILVTSAGQVKITDFGVAKAADAAPVTRSGMVMGTAHYIAPEQALGQPAEPASDVYSLAVCGYECLAGHRPFLSENAVTVAMMHIRDIAPPLPPDVPPAARAVIEATLVKDPRQRYNNGGEFAAAVAAVRAGLPLPTPSGLVNATYATGQQPQQQQPQQPPPSAPIPVPPQQLSPPQQPMPVGPPSPAMNPMVAIGPPSRPAVRQVMVPAPRKKTQWGWWALLAAILLVVLVAGIVLVAKMLGGGGSPPHTGQTQSEVVPGRQAPAEEPGSSAGAASTPGTTDDGQQGIMTTPWTEWNGTQR